MTGIILYGKKFLPEKSSVSRYFPSILYSMTSSSSFLHPAPGRTASFSDIIFAAIQVLDLQFQASLSLTRPDLASKQAASQILPEGSLRTNQGKLVCLGPAYLFCSYTDLTKHMLQFSLHSLYFMDVPTFSLDLHSDSSAQMLEVHPLLPEYFALADKKLSNTL